MSKEIKVTKTFGLGSEAPDFKSQTTMGDIESFHKWKESHWTVFFSFPGAFTPVCTTDIGAVADLQKVWDAKKVKVIGLSCSSMENHRDWICEVNSIMNCQVKFPMISDPMREIAQKYNMLDFQGGHSLFI
jgi:alkyl hydroperoxide reductase subunit AhpC